jgi:lipoprotein-releasing system ATP-binding protein
MILSGKNIRRWFVTGKDQRLTVLKGIDIEIEKGEIVAISGPSGAGKSTLLHILGLLDRPSEGEVYLDGTNPLSLGDEALAAFRNQQIGFVFQFHHLLPEFTALENVVMPSLIAGKKFNTVHDRGMQLLRDVGVEDRAEHKPNELSGGEQQRVAVARALMNSPQVVLADEPSGNLDTENATSLHSMIFDLRQRYGQTFVIVTHNKEFAAMADRIVTMVDGMIKE